MKSFYSSTNLQYINLQTQDVSTTTKLSKTGQAAAIEITSKQPSETAKGVLEMSVSPKEKVPKPTKVGQPPVIITPLQDITLVVGEKLRIETTVYGCFP